MKYILISGLLVVIMACETTPTQADQPNAATEPRPRDTLRSETPLNTEPQTPSSKLLCEQDVQGLFETALCFELHEVITVDLNGDRTEEEVSFSSGEGGLFLIIKDGQSQTETSYGPGRPMEGLGEDFQWVEYWGILYDSTSYEIIVQDGEVIGDTIMQLINPSLFLHQSEVGGGLISFKDGVYRWVHQAD